MHLELPALYLILTDTLSFSMQAQQNTLWKIAKPIHFLSQCIKWTSLRLCNGPNRRQVSPMTILLSPLWWHLPSMWQVTSWGQWPLDKTEPILLCGAQCHGYIGGLGTWKAVYTNIQTCNPQGIFSRSWAEISSSSKGFYLCGSMWDCGEIFILQILFRQEFWDNKMTWL